MTSDENRSYRQTHPWIDFTTHLDRATMKFWMLLGEAGSKCEHIAGVPLRPSTAQELHILYLAKGARATTAIEGNTLSEEEVSKLVRKDLELPPSKEYLGKEVDNILEACNSIIDDLMGGEVRQLTANGIKEANAKVLNGLKLDHGVVGGVVRTHSVGVSNYRGAPVQDCDYLIAKLCDWINEADFIYGEVGKIGIAIIKAIIAHLYLAWIHPFGDGNGRTARLVEYEILVCSGVPSPAAHLLSNHYNETRSEYYRQLDQASKTGSPIEFFQYALQGFVDGLHAQLDVIKNQQWLVAWENYVHSQFRTRISAVDIRRRNLVLDLSKEIGPVPKSDIRVMTPRLAEAYVGKTLKTITRDINTLADMGLVTKSPQGVEANMGIILAFLPLSGPVVPMNEEENGQLQFTL